MWTCFHFLKKLIADQLTVLSLASANGGSYDPKDAMAKIVEGIEGEGKWQSIETAPKDGTQILLWETGSTIPFVGYWYADSLSPSRSRWTASTEHYDTNGDAIVINNLWQEGVTHWMPLPQPPI